MFASKPDRVQVPDASPSTMPVKGTLAGAPPGMAILLLLSGLLFCAILLVLPVGLLVFRQGKANVDQPFLARRSPEPDSDHSELVSFHEFIDKMGLEVVADREREENRGMCYLNPRNDSNRMECETLFNFAQRFGSNCQWKAEEFRPHAHGVERKSSRHLRGRKPFRIGFFGGSITMNSADCCKGKTYVDFVQANLQKLGYTVEVENNAIAGAGAQYWLTCPPENPYDVIFSDYAVNDLDYDRLAKWYKFAQTISRFVVVLDLFPWVYDGHYVSPALAVANQMEEDPRVCAMTYSSAVNEWWPQKLPFTRSFLFDRGQAHIPEMCLNSSAMVNSKECTTAPVSNYIFHGNHNYHDLLALAVTWPLTQLLDNLADVDDTHAAESNSSNAAPTRCYGTYGRAWTRKGAKNSIQKHALSEMAFLNQSGFEYGDAFDRNKGKESMFSSKVGSNLTVSVPQCCSDVSIGFVGHGDVNERATFRVRLPGFNTIVETIGSVGGHTRTVEYTDFIPVGTGEQKTFSLTVVSVMPHAYVEITDIIFRGCHRLD
jgi:hypothetical protein